MVRVVVCWGAGSGVGWVFLRGAAGFKLGAVSRGVCVFGMEVCGVAAASRGDLRWDVFDTRWIWADATWLGAGWVGFKGRRRRRGGGGGEEEQGEGALVGFQRSRA